MTTNDKAITDLKRRATDIIQRHRLRDNLLERYREVYFMDNLTKPKNRKVDPKDWKVTPSPSGRNEVVGMHRLLNTSEIQVKIGNKRASDKIENGLKTMLKVSGEGRRGRVLSDMNLSAVLDGSVVTYAESIDDLLATKGLSPAKKIHLAKKRLRTPFLLRTMNSYESYTDWDEDMLITHVRRYQIRGSVLKNRYGEGKVKVKDNLLYTVDDIFTTEDRLIYCESNEPLYYGKHGLDCVPIFVTYAGGSDMFIEPERQVQSFLYAKVMAELDRRETSVLTAIFTNMHNRGLLGQLLAINPDNVPETIEINHLGGVRYIIADARQVDEHIISPEIFQVKELLDQLSSESTVYKQTLGENVGAGNMPFSSLSLLSNSGKLPLVDSTRAVEQNLTDLFNHVLYRIKNEGIKNDLIAPADITDEMIVEVSLEAKLPQDSLRNAQIASALGGLVSDEWKHGELLQIGNSTEMQNQVMREDLKKAIFAAMVQDPNIMQQAISAIMGVPPPPPPAQPGGTQPSAMPDETMMPDEMMQGQPNMEATPMTAPMAPQQEQL